MRDIAIPEEGQKHGNDYEHTGRTEQFKSRIDTPDENMHWCNWEDEDHWDDDSENTWDE